MTTCESDCSCHISPITHVPCCPRHSLPLYAAEAGLGQCPWVGRVMPARDFPGFARERCITWAPRNWLWRHRDNYNSDELPPHNGYQAPRYPSPGGPVWDRHEHHCSDCDTYTVHVVGDNRSVCTECGVAAWVPDPQYTDAS